MAWHQQGGRGLAMNTPGVVLWGERDLGFTHQFNNKIIIEGLPLLHTSDHGFL